MKNFTRIFILTVFIIIWISKPIPYEEVVHNRNQFVREEILTLGGGAQDSTDANFIPPNTGMRTSTSSSQQNPQPKAQKDQTNANIGQKLTYKQSGDPGGKGFGAGNIDEDLPEIPDLKDTISDSEFWDKVQNQEPKDSEEKEGTVSSPPTYKLTKESIKENDFLEKQRQPLLFQDWEGETRIIKGKELKKSIFSHGIEAGTSTPEDLVECPIQTDPTKYQRKDCSRITNKTAENFSKKIIDLTTSREIGMVKFKLKMPYYDSEIAIGHMNVLTGECMFFHQNGKYWGYKKYKIEQIPSLIGDVSSSLKWASKNSSPGSEL